MNKRALLIEINVNRYCDILKCGSLTSIKNKLIESLQYRERNILYLVNPEYETLCDSLEWLMTNDSSGDPGVFDDNEYDNSDNEYDNSDNECDSSSITSSDFKIHSNIDSRTTYIHYTYRHYLIYYLIHVNVTNNVLVSSDLKQGITTSAFQQYINRLPKRSSLTLVTDSSTDVKLDIKLKSKRSFTHIHALNDHNLLTTMLNSYINEKHPTTLSEFDKYLREHNTTLTIDWISK